MVSFRQSLVPFSTIGFTFFACVGVIALIYSVYCWLRVCFIEEMLWLPSPLPFLETHSMTREGHRYNRRFYVSLLTAVAAFNISVTIVYFGE